MSILSNKIVFASAYNSIRGNCYDDAVTECFFKTLKKELVKKETFLTRDLAAFKMFEYLEMFYNSKRMHYDLDYMFPNKFEKSHNL